MWFWVSNMEISKTSQKLHFRVTKKDACFPFHIHVLSLFKLSRSNLGFDKDSNGHRKNQEKEKPKQIVFLCHIVSQLIKLINKV
jgi:hypothetical protein